MEAAQIALKLVLEELGVEPDIATVSRRKALQKAIYLGQVAGIDLGYRYNWYVMGPYSPGLTRDYFAMDEALRAGEEMPVHALKSAVSAALARVKPLMLPPVDVHLSPADWLELLASADYLLRVRRMSKESAQQLLVKQKPHVASYFEQAIRALRESGLQAA